MTGDTDIGLQADSPMAICRRCRSFRWMIWKPRWTGALAAGAVLVTPIFSFPGGRRFHVCDPGGNEIAVMAGEG
jgi:hypothetical protein